MINEKFISQLKFIKEVDKVKSIFRQTRLMDNSRYENDAEHSWHLAICILMLQEHSNFEHLDTLRMIKMVLIHDIVEIDCGDVIVYDTKRREEIKAEEAKAAKRIFGILPKNSGDEYIELFEEFEKRETNEAKFAAALDRFQPILHNYETNGYTWKKHGIKKSDVIKINSHVKEGSEVLWNYLLEIFDNSVKKGFLIDG